MGAYAYVAEEVAPVVMRAWQVARPAVQAYAKRAAKGMATRMFVDAGFQFGTSYLTADPTASGRARQAVRSINGMQVVGAGAVSVGEEARLGAKFLVGLGTAATTNFLTLSRGNVDKYNSYWHTVDFHNSGQVVEYVRNVVIGTLADPLKELGAGTIAKRFAGRAEEWAGHASGRATQAVLKWVTESRVELPASLVLGSLVEVPKKLWERHHEEQEQREEKEKAEALRRAMPHSSKPVTPR